MKKKACLFVFDGLADWEPAHAFCVIRKSNRFDIITAGFSRQPVTTMAGLRLVPDLSLDEVDCSDLAFFMLPGGDMWQEKSHETVKTVLRQLHEQNVLIGAICAATLEVARAGLTRGIHHTSNSKHYLKGIVHDYRDEAFYIDKLAVTDANIITASGLGSVEFAREVIRELGLYSETDEQIWFDMFKNGVIPAAMA
jgi:putative intracellular protease/amidase